MRLTALYLGDEERVAIAALMRATWKKQSECVRLAIREGAKRLNTRNSRRRTAEVV